MANDETAALRQRLELPHPLIPRTVAFDVPTFDRLKMCQRWLEGHPKAHLGNAEVLKYLVYTHPEAVALVAGVAGYGR